jgi:hypothetical protein
LSWPSRIATRSRKSDVARRISFRTIFSITSGLRFRQTQHPHRIRADFLPFKFTCPARFSVFAICANQSFRASAIALSNAASTSAFVRPGVSFHSIGYCFSGLIQPKSRYFGGG